MCQVTKTDGRVDRNATVKVVAVIDTFSFSGPGRQLISAIPLLREKNVSVKICTFTAAGQGDSEFIKYLRRNRIDVTVINYIKKLDLTALRSLERYLDEWQPDIVQTHNYRPTLLAAVMRLRGASWRWIGFYHGATHENLRVRLYHWLDRLLLRSADTVVVMSGRQRRQFRPKKDVKIIHNAVLEPIGTQSGLAESRMPPRSDGRHPVIGFVGRLSREKGIDLAIRTIADLHNTGCSATLLVAGDGPELETSRLLAAKLGIERFVRILGFVEDVREVYRAIDLLLISSRSEGLPNSLLEAIKMRVPVVTTDVGAVADVLDGAPPAIGTVVLRKKPRALAKAVRSALRACRDEDVEAIQSVIEERFSLDRRVERLSALYSDPDNTAIDRECRKSP
jgi:glycosyltransferase involved in cell wall biosynthesis